MGGGSTADFFSFIDEQNNSIAAAEAEKLEPSGLDQIRIKRDTQRREKFNEPMRARSHKGARPVTGRVVRGYMENPE